MSGRQIIEHESISAGQLRSYGDHIYESYLTFSVPEGQVWSSKWPTMSDQVVPFAKLLVRGWYDEPEWHQARLKKLEQVSTNPNRWHVIVTIPYLD